ncbi:DUF2891 domain-containing protein [Segetibacter sp. 3557_3]|uniref:DUF2891 domain-containing protein n=1 Tax=Segetibacter sp. 3557_3 TaxID=2547429 RepID=UPI001058D519|nr:DUF2891 domain-containing protein [Segetibacter sp. 3557_3]TDH26586.1 DUF2891 domain-containing protein [Segetibacter sp. 3557_3]
MFKKKVIVPWMLAILSTAGLAQSSNNNAVKELSLTKAVAEQLAAYPLKCVVQEYPNKPSNILEKPADAQGPQQMHPAFYGCFDWHSSVHGHWMLVRLLKKFPDLSNAALIRQVLNQNLSAANIEKERQYFALPINATYERMYGWAWLLKLAEELHTWNDAQAKQWEKNLQPLTDLIIKRTAAFLPKQTYPIRQGMHPNTAFALAFVHDYANTTNNDTLKRIVELRSRDYFLKDTKAPLEWEPSGSDFLSPALEEADLMRRVLSRAEFKTWINNFLPRIAETKPANILKPIAVTDRTDLQLVHLDGLNFSRAWCMFGIAQALPKTDPLHKLFVQSAHGQLSAAFPNIASGHYGGEHWLASFMLYALDMSAGVGN